MKQLSRVLESCSDNKHVWHKPLFGNVSWIWFVATGETGRKNKRVYNA